MKLSFDCVFHFVRDMDRAVLLYSNVLGMSLLSRDTIARFDIDGVLFELVPAPEGQEMTGKANARLCLRVDDIERASRMLGELGVSTGVIEDMATGRLVFFDDPDGNEICLWQYR